jgi:hypothetical protein
MSEGSRAPVRQLMPNVFVYHDDPEGDTALQLHREAHVDERLKELRRSAERIRAIARGADTEQMRPVADERMEAVARGADTERKRPRAGDGSGTSGRKRGLSVKAKPVKSKGRGRRRAEPPSSS